MGGGYLALRTRGCWRALFLPRQSIKWRLVFLNSILIFRNFQLFSIRVLNPDTMLSSQADPGVANPIKAMYFHCFCPHHCSRGAQDNKQSRAIRPTMPQRRKSQATAVRRAKSDPGASVQIEELPQSREGTQRGGYLPVGNEASERPALTLEPLVSE